MIRNRLIAGILVLAMLLPSPLWAAVAFDAASEGNGGGASNLTVSHTISGSNRVLYACLAGYDADYAVGDVTATYDSVSMDVFFTDTATNANRPTRVFRLVAPNTGTHNIVYSWPSGTRYFTVSNGSFTGVDQADPDDAQSATDGSGGNDQTSQAISSATDDMVMDCLVGNTGMTGLVVNQGNTLIASEIGAGLNAIGTSYEAGAASVTIGWDWTEYTDFVHFGWNINAATGGGSACLGRFSMLGVGGC